MGTAEAIVEGGGPRGALGERGRGELRALARLSLPLVVGQLGNPLMGVVDTAMVGRLGPVSLAGVAVGNGIYMVVSMLAMGCVLGAEPLVTQAAGAGEWARARRVFWQSLRAAGLVAPPSMAALALSPAALSAAGVEPAVVGEASRFLLGRVPNLALFLAFVAARTYLQACGRTRPIVLSMVAGNLANFVGNALLIYGDGALEAAGLPPAGLPALGVLGAGLASSAAAALSLAVVAAGVRRAPAPEDPSRRALDRAIVSSTLRLGAFIGLQLVAEVATFAAVSVLVGRLGALAAAGHQIALTLVSVTFNVAAGIGSATAVRVGHAVGRGDAEGARAAGRTALAASALLMASASALFALAPRALARLLTDDAAVVEATAPLVMIAGAFQLADGLQAVVAGALRGAGDARVPLLASLSGHYAVGLPCALALGLLFDLGAKGLWAGFSAGVTVAAAALVVRFFRLSGRGIARAA